MRRRVVLLTFGAGALALLACELGLRLMESDPPHLGCLPDPRFHYALAPGTDTVFHHRPADGGGTVNVHINSQGFRGEELQPAGSSRRVVVYGDSFIQAEPTDLPATFVQRLGARLSVEAVNAGTIGYGPDQVCLRMEEELPMLAPDLVVVAIFAGNDFGDLMRNKLFDLDAQGDLRQSDPIVTDDLMALASGAPTGSRLVPLLRKGWHALPRIWRRQTAETAWRETYDAMLDSLDREYRDYVLAGDRHVRNLMFDYYDVDVRLEPERESTRYKLRLMEQVIRRMKQLTDRQRVPLILMIIPAAIDVAEGRGFRELAAQLYPAYRPQGATSLLADMADRQGIPCVDLFAAFDAQGGAALFFVDDSHWNAAGQDLAAGHVADFVLKRGLWRSR